MSFWFGFAIGFMCCILFGLIYLEIKMNFDEYMEGKIKDAISEQGDGGSE